MNSEYRNDQAIIDDIVIREKAFYNNLWEKTKVENIKSELKIPTISSLKGKRVLICSCGTGSIVVKAANAGADTYAFDISEIAVIKAREMVSFNKANATVDVMDFHHLLYPNDFYDLIYGSAILHHVDCEIVGNQIYRCLKPGGIAYFEENSDRNPILRFFRKLLFGKPGERQRKKFLFFKRDGTLDEYPLTEQEIQVLQRIFHGNLERTYKDFYFFRLINYLIFKNRNLEMFFKKIDELFSMLFPFIKKYSFYQEIILKKPLL